MDQSTTYARAPDEKIAWGSSLPYILLHVLAIVGLFYFPPTWELVLVAVGAYYLRMFGITAGYHRYFSHRSYKTGRIFQFILALLGSFSSQKGVLWWAGHHRHHHKHSDQPEDIHSPKRGFWWAHHLWILCPKYDETPVENIRDFNKYPELRFLNRTWLVWPFVFGGLLALIGGAAWAFWGGLVSTVVLWHGTFTINSLTHLWGSVRYATTDTSKNSFILALVTMGEGWHNNHHFYQSTANQGFYWWEIDMSYYILKVLSWFGVVKDLRTPPQWVLDGGERRYPQTQTRPGVQPELQVAGTFAFPAALVETMQSLATLRDEAATKKHLLTRLGPLAADAAEKAADVAQKAAVAATEAKAAAVDLKAKLAVAAADAADRAAALAREASDAAVEAAESVKDRAAQTWAESATKAAEAAAEAAASARAVRAEIAA